MIDTIMQEQTLTNMFPLSGLCEYEDRPQIRMIAARIITIAGTPNAAGKQSFIPKHFTSCRRIGLKKRPMIDPDFMQKYCIEK